VTTGLPLRGCRASIASSVATVRSPMRTTSRATWPHVSSRGEGEPREAVVLDDRRAQEHDAGPRREALEDPSEALRPIPATVERDHERQGLVPAGVASQHLGVLERIGPVDDVARARVAARPAARHRGDEDPDHHGSEAQAHASSVEHDDGTRAPAPEDLARATGTTSELGRDRPAAQNCDQRYWFVISWWNWISLVFTRLPSARGQRSADAALSSANFVWTVSP